MKNGRVWSFDPYVERHDNVRWRQLISTVNETSVSALVQSVLHKVFYTKTYLFYYPVIIRRVHYQKALYLILKILSNGLNYRCCVCHFSLVAVVNINGKKTDV